MEGDARTGRGEHRHGAAEALHAAVARGAFARADDPAVPRGWPAGLPERIVQFWHEADPPPDVREMHARVVAHHPRAQCELYSEERARAFVAEHFDADVLAAYDGSVHPAMRCDLFRLCELWVRGGVYLDVDIDCEANLAGVLPSEPFGCLLLFWRPEPGRVVVRNDVIAAPPASAFVARLLDLVVANIAALHRGAPFVSVRMVSGPGAYTRLLAGLAADRDPADGPPEGLVLAPWVAGEGILRHARMTYDDSAAGNWRSWHGLGST